MDTVETLRRDMDRLEAMLTAISENSSASYVSQKVFDNHVEQIKLNHDALLARFDKFVDDNKDTGFILKTYMENVHAMGETLRVLVESVQELKLKNDLINEGNFKKIDEQFKDLHAKLFNGSLIEQHLNKYKVGYILGSAVIAILAVFSPESIPHLIDAIINKFGSSSAEPTV